jgi:hypothetical protein
MMNLETKDGVLTLILGIMMPMLGIMIHFLVIVWNKGKRYENMLLEEHGSRALVLAAQGMFIQNNLPANRLATRHRVYGFLTSAC